MRLRVLAVGARMPAWVSAGVDEYHKRLPRDFSVEWVEVAPAKRSGSTVPQMLRKEAEAIEKRLRPGEPLIALDAQGSVVTTETMAETFADLQMAAGKAAIVIGGPDGIEPGLLARAQLRWAFGRITLPHPLVRVVLSEQIYRAWSVMAGHPYHRA